MEIKDSFNENYNYYEKEFLNTFKKNLEIYRYLTPVILQIIAEDYANFQNKCKKTNDVTLREALGDACILLSLDRKPNKKDMHNYLYRIKQAIFSEGITNFHHSGEKAFYEKYIKDFEEKIELK